MSKKNHPDPSVTFVSAKLPISALAARWRIPAAKLEAALRRLAGYPTGGVLQIELPPESTARALHAGRRMLDRGGDDHEF